MKVKEEYERLKVLFEGLDENQINLIDGAILECARLKVELDKLYEVEKVTGSIKVNPNNPTQQKELPIAKQLIKIRSNYLNYVAKLSAILGKKIILEDEEDEDLNDYE